MVEATRHDVLRREFNRWAEAGRGEQMEQEHLPIVLPVLDRMRLQPDDNVLDVGCGTGWLVRLLAEQVPDGRVVGMDISDQMIRRARRRYVDMENSMFAIGEAEVIPWDSSFFTRMISVESAYYWPDPLRGLRESFRVLREGGSAWVLMNYYGDNPHSHHWSEILSVPAHLMSSGRWAELFCEAGFTDVVHECIPDPTPVPEGYNGRWFQDVSQLRAFREFGSLLVQGVKPRL